MLITKELTKRNTLLEEGMFGFIGNFFARMFSSKATKQLAPATLQAGISISIPTLRNGLKTV